MLKCIAHRASRSNLSTASVTALEVYKPTQQPSPSNAGIPYAHQEKRKTMHSSALIYNPEPLHTEFKAFKQKSFNDIH
jgi:hypothetical protein